MPHRNSRNRKAPLPTSAQESTHVASQTVDFTETKSEKQSVPAVDSKALGSLKDTLHSFRQDLTCKICFRLLYEPFTNPCGHTFCYSCLCQWFQDKPRGKKKTCPDCRAIVTSQPAPAYLLRNLTSKVFQQLGTFGEDGETREDHERMKAEEASLVEADRANTDPDAGGLFKGCFKIKAIGGSRFAAIQDIEDNVVRCPGCAWELEEDLEQCTRCGYMIDGEYSEDSDYDSEEQDIPLADGLLEGTYTDDEELDEELAQEDSEAFPHSDIDIPMEDATVSDLEAAVQNYSHTPHISREWGDQSEVSDSDSESSTSTARADDEASEEDESGMEDFINDDASVDNSDLSGSEDNDVSTQPRRSANRYRIVDDDDDDSSDEILSHTSQDSVMGEDSDSSDDDDPPIVTNARRRAHASQSRHQQQAPQSQRGNRRQHR